MTVYENIKALGLMICAAGGSLYLWLVQLNPIWDFVDGLVGHSNLFTGALNIGLVINIVASPFAVAGVVWELVRSRND